MIATKNYPLSRKPAIRSASGPSPPHSAEFEQQLAASRGRLHGYERGNLAQ
jgi:hypothetical protein